MTYEEFLKFVPAKCIYETIYEDTEGRPILVISLLDAYGMVNKAQHHAQLSATRRAVESSGTLDQTQRLVHIRECHDALARKYVPTAYGGAMLLMRADNVADGFSFNREMGWDGLVGDLRIVDIPGDHEHIFYEPHAAELAAKFQFELDRLEQAGALVT